MGWILGLWANPLVRKCIIYGAAIVAILLCLRWYGNAQWEKGVSYGDARTSVKMQKAYEDKWQEAQKQLDSQRKLMEEGVKKNEADRNVLSARAQELERSRQSIVLALAKAMAVAEAGKKSGYDAGLSLTDLTVDDAIRRLSADLERQRDASGAAEPK